MERISISNNMLRVKVFPNRLNQAPVPGSGGLAAAHMKHADLRRGQVFWGQFAERPVAAQLQCWKMAVWLCNVEVNHLKQQA